MVMLDAIEICQRDYKGMLIKLGQSSAGTKKTRYEYCNFKFFSLTAKLRACSRLPTLLC